MPPSNPRVPNASLSARGVGLRYADAGVDALRDVDIELQPGRVTGIVGPNGSGKSTLLRVLAGLLPADVGEVRLGERAVGSLPARERAREIGYLPQSPVAAPGFTVAELVAFGRSPHLGALGFLPPEDRGIVDRCLVQAGVQDMAGRLLTTLSGGERQRAFLAAVLAQTPRVLLLDEPTAALDLHHQAALFTLLRGQAQEAGFSVAVASHNLTLAAQACDTLLLLGAGRVVARGEPAEVLTEPTLQEVYGEGIAVGTHPVTGTPTVMPTVPRTPAPPHPRR